MKITAKKQKVMEDEDGSGVLILDIISYGDLLQLKELSKEETLAIDINIKKSKRSLDQNKYMWALIRDIDIARNGRSTTNASWDIYIELLERAGVKSDVIAAPEAAEKELKKSFRAIKYLYKHSEDKAVYKVYYGSSKFSISEMKELIDNLLDMAAEEDINTGYWEEILKW